MSFQLIELSAFIATAAAICLKPSRVESRVLETRRSRRVDSLRHSRRGSLLAMKNWHDVKRIRTRPTQVDLVRGTKRRRNYLNEIWIVNVKEGQELTRMAKGKFH
jgi:hypothetical protein